GQVFITEALLTRLQTEGQLAGVLGHEIGHVLGRHSAERMAKAELSQGLVTGVAVGASGETGGRGAGMLASTVANYLGLKYSRDHELEADALGLRIMFAAGYDPRSLIGVMEILEAASGGAAARNRPDFAATHPNPGRRIERIEAEIAALFPTGVPSDLRR
ncbi:MAG: M48 family metallopeptidase, partial [Phycisphaerales bacterium]|nr:M48 family metallopeptidase [Phycisphaerales bacterium]